MSKHPIRDVDVTSRVVMLTYGRMQDGNGHFWCYVAVKPSEYDRFKKVQKAGQLDLRTFEADEFGEVIVSGPGLTPPNEVTVQVGALFNTPIKDLFGNMDPETVISQKIAQLKKGDQG